MKLQILFISHQNDVDCDIVVIYGTNFFWFCLYQYDEENNVLGHRLNIQPQNQSRMQKLIVNFQIE